MWEYYTAVTVLRRILLPLLTSQCQLHAFFSVELNIFLWLWTKDS